MRRLALCLLLAVSALTSLPAAEAQQYVKLLVGNSPVSVSNPIPTTGAGGGGSSVVQLLDSGGTNKASVSAGGAVKVDGSAVSQPVTGTFWQATQPVSGTVTSNQGGSNWTVNLNQLAGGSVLLGNGLATGALRVTIASDSTGQITLATGANVIGAVTQSGTWNLNNISGTISLPTGAATAAKQPALGTAGSASTDVITVQGITSMTALKVDGSAVTQPSNITQINGTAVSTTNAMPATGAGTTTANETNTTAAVPNTDTTVTFTAAASTVVIKTDTNAAALYFNFNGTATTSNFKVDGGGAYIYHGAPRSSVHILGASATGNYSIHAY